jgi:uncharacterized membrane protein YkvA (DUF1232 family)
VIAILLGVVIALVVMWAILLVCFVALRPPGATLRDAARIVPDTVRLVHRLARDRRIGRGTRLGLFLLLGYLSLPIDLVPDFIPVLGYADDAILIGIVVRGVIRRAGPAIVREHWPGSDDGLALLARLCRLPDLTTTSS